MITSTYRSLDEYETAHPEVEKSWCACCDRLIFPDSIHFTGGRIEGLGVVCRICLEEESVGAA